MHCSSTVFMQWRCSCSGKEVCWYVYCQVKWCFCCEVTQTDKACIILFCMYHILPYLQYNVQLCMYCCLVTGLRVSPSLKGAYYVLAAVLQHSTKEWGWIPEKNILKLVHANNPSQPYSFLPSTEHSCSCMHVYDIERNGRTKYKSTWYP